MVKVFGTVGSQKFQFNRFVKSLDNLDKNEFDVFIQTGYSDYVPRNCRYITFLDRDSFAEKIKECDVVVTHGGTGSIISALRAGKPVIAIPRRSTCGEHVDDHQFEIVHTFAEGNFIVCCDDEKNLESMIKNSLSRSFTPFVSHTSDFIEQLIECIEDDR